MILTAEDFVREHKLPSCSGYVLFYDGKPCAWSREPEPKGWVPGVIALRMTDHQIFIARGGNDQHGATRWESL